jgi:hypothetical protein
MRLVAEGSQGRMCGRSCSMVHAVWKFRQQPPFKSSGSSYKTSIDLSVFIYILLWLLCIKFSGISCTFALVAGICRVNCCVQFWRWLTPSRMVAGRGSVSGARVMPRRRFWRGQVKAAIVVSMLKTLSSMLHRLHSILSRLRSVSFAKLSWNRDEIANSWHLNEGIVTSTISTTCSAKSRC